MSVACEMLLHPELLSNEQLLWILNERQLRILNLASMNRDQLLEIFHQYCVPFGQRKYRDSGRGKLLNKTRSMDVSPEKTRLNHQAPHKHHADGMKPPPDLLSGHFKRIKMSDVERTDSDISFKRKLNLTNSKSTDSPPCKKERKLITWP